jgi:competence protein ComFC
MSRYLRRTRATASQTSLGWSERATNVRGAFAAKPRVFVGKRVLLVDDAFTTGATANEISRILLDAGAIVVCVAVLTRASVALAPRS